MTRAPPLTDREAGILSAAFQTFAIYGFRRTAMDDIAQAAGLSRTALYLHYRNKEEIFRALVHATFAQASLEMEIALAQPDLTIDQALVGCFAAKDGKFIEMILTTPHGADLLDPGFAVSGDLAIAGEARMTVVLSEWFEGQGVPDAIGPASALADTVMAALKGLRYSATTVEDLRAGEMRLAAILARALT